MGKLKITIHPLFFIFGLYFAAIGKVFSFLTYVCSAALHEIGHATASERRGYRLDRITLMPYGAVISGDVDGLGYKDECAIVVAGPTVNLAIYLCVVASWWLFPETYPYTEIAATANLALFAINLLPAYPLDGGRLLLCTLSLAIKRKTAVAITRATGVVLSLVLLAAFIWSCFVAVNFSILFFAAFTLVGALDKNAKDRYVRIFSSVDTASAKKCKAVKTIAVNENATIKDLYGIIDGDSLYRITVYDGRGRKVRTYEPEEVTGLFTEKSLYEKIA